MTHVLQFIAIFFVTGFLTLPLAAQEEPGGDSVDELDQPFAIQGTAVLTQGELDAVFSKIPEEHRIAFIRNGERVNQVVGAELRYKLLAGEAKAAGIDQDPILKRRMAIAAEKELAGIWLEQVVSDAPEADYESLAHEYFLANPEAFHSEEVLDVSHILVSSEQRSAEEALELALSIREQVLEDPSRFEDLVKQYSEDPSKASNGGRFPKMKRGQMVAPFEEQAFSMTELGEVSEPVETAFGYHIIRLNAIYPSKPRPFEEVKAGLMEQQRNQYLSDYRSRYVRQLVSEPIVLPDGAVEVMVKRHFGENLELAPVYQE